MIALAAHGGKTAVRAAVTPSPEPFSNIALSLGEDALAVLLTWMATWKPYVAASIAAVLLLLIVLLVRWVWESVAGAISRSGARDGGLARQLCALAEIVTRSDGDSDRDRLRGLGEPLAMRAVEHRNCGRRRALLD